MIEYPKAQSATTEATTQPTITERIIGTAQNMLSDRTPGEKVYNPAYDVRLTRGNHWITIKTGDYIEPGASVEISTHGNVPEGRATYKYFFSPERTWRRTIIVGDDEVKVEHPEADEVSLAHLYMSLVGSSRVESLEDYPTLLQY